MTPLYACFPICLTFVALAVLGMLVFVTGVYSREQLPDAAPAPTDEGPSGRPPLWVAVLIFVAVLLHFVLLLWLWPEL